MHSVCVWKITFFSFFSLCVQSRMFEYLNHLKNKPRKILVIFSNNCDDCFEPHFNPGLIKCVIFESCPLVRYIMSIYDRCLICFWFLFFNYIFFCPSLSLIHWTYLSKSHLTRKKNTEQLQKNAFDYPYSMEQHLLLCIFNQTRFFFRCTRWFIFEKYRNNKYFTKPIKVQNVNNQH